MDSGTVRAPDARARACDVWLEPGLLAFRLHPRADADLAEEEGTAGGG